jgi:hypothetical protein
MDNHDVSQLYPSIAESGWFNMQMAEKDTDTSTNSCPNGHTWDAPLVEGIKDGNLIFYKDYGGFCSFCGAAGMGESTRQRLFSL